MLHAGLLHLASLQSILEKNKQSPYNDQYFNKIKTRLIRLYILLNQFKLLKRVRIIIVSLLIGYLSLMGKGYGQKQWILNMPTYDQDRFHFGFVLGANLSYVTIRPIKDLTTHNFDSIYIPDIVPLPDSAKVLSITSAAAVGFVISIVTNMRLAENFDLRFIPSLSFGDRQLIYTIEFYKNESESIRSITKDIPSTYVNFPLEIKFKSDRYNNFRAYLLGGAQYTLDLASQAKKREQRNSDQKIVKFNGNDVYLEAGAGFDFYNEWFKLGLEFKMMYGLLDQLKRENNIYTNSIQSLKAKIFQFSVSFE